MTYHPKSEFLATIIERGFLADCTDLQALDEALRTKGVPAYIGYDATAKSLHVGHLLNIMLLRWYQKAGGRPITLMGGGTTKVGDPSFRADERPLLSTVQINRNIEAMKQVFSQYLDYGDGGAAQSALWAEIDHVLRKDFFGRRKKATSEDYEKQFDLGSMPTLVATAVRRLPDTPEADIRKSIEARIIARMGEDAGSRQRANTAIMLNNEAWLDKLNYLSFLRDIGRHFSVNRMLSFESVKSRLDREQSLSFLEFNYMILQAYDFLELNRRYGCMLQMGGSDQWGNIVNGIDLTRRVAETEIFGLTTPLLTTSDGRKMGKSQGGAIWLSADLLSPYEFWQFWRNTTDADVGRFLKLYTELPVDECARLGALSGSEINDAKIRLANEVTTLLHGADAAKAAEATAREVFEKGGVGDDLPTLALNQDEVADGISVVQLIVRSGLAKSGKEAKRLIADGGAKLDDAPLSDAGLMLDADALASPVKLSAGKKRHAMVTLNG